MDQTIKRSPLLGEKCIEAVIEILSHDSAGVPPRLVATAILSNIYHVLNAPEIKEPDHKPVSHKPYYIGDNTVSIDLWLRSRGRIASA